MGLAGPEARLRDLEQEARNRDEAQKRRRLLSVISCIVTYSDASLITAQVALCDIDTNLNPLVE